MREVIQKVIATETAAKQLVQAAQSEADQLVTRARMQARDLVERAQREARLEAEKILAAAEAEAAREKAERLARAAAEIKATIRLDDAMVQQTVAAALRCVCGSSAQRREKAYHDPRLSNDLDYLATRLHARRSRMAEKRAARRLVPPSQRVRTGPRDFSGRRNFPPRPIFSGGWFKIWRRKFPGVSSIWMRRIRISSPGCWRGFKLKTQKFAPRIFESRFARNVAAASGATAGRLRPGRGRVAGGQIAGGICRAAAGGQSAQPLARSRGQPARRPPPFVLEAALDAGYFQELLARNNRLPAGELEIIKPLVCQETNLFQFMLVVRGKFHFGLSAETLLPLRVSGSGDVAGLVPHGVDRSRLLSRGEMRRRNRHGHLARGGAVGGEQTAIDISVIEALAWQRFLRLAN